MLKNISSAFEGTNYVQTEKVPTKVNFFGRRCETKDILTINGFKTEDNEKVDALMLINPSFIEEVSNFLSKEPNNEFAQKIAKTLVRGVSFE